jgi:hypothetical protein
MTHSPCRPRASLVAAFFAAALAVNGCATSVSRNTVEPAPRSPAESASAARPGGADSGRAAPYDVVIRNGRVFDGAGNPWIRADVAIRDGRFVKIGKVEGRGAREIDAAGKYVSPGWIDMMDQSGSVLPRNGLAENKLRMGVTTAIGGEGGTPVPAGEVACYFDKHESQGISINYGSY